ncbi:MAG: ATP-grasp domain-containing protein [Acidobacteriota bacterium]
MLWCIQKSSSSDSPAILNEACTAAGFDTFYFETQANALPDVGQDQPVIFYGSCFFIRNVARSRRWKPGVYFDEEIFRFSQYMAHYGTRMLNHDAYFTTLEELSTTDLSKEEHLFIRSDSDLKELPGYLWPTQELILFIEKLKSSGKNNALKTPIVVAPRKRLEYEWRLFIVDNQVSSGSQYGFYGDLELSPIVPHEVVAFAEEIVAIWSPARAFVIDIVSIKSDLFVMELNGINTSGFYRANVTKIITDLANGIEATLV